jgi:2-(1,2-epoxy-1,2-dihydrophenyl)acetyl-CoA isomerase
MTDSLLVDRAGAVVTLTLNRPDAMNALDVELKEALRDTLASLESDRSCRAIVLAGAGRAFCVGQDLREHAATLASGRTDLDTVRAHYNPIAQRLASMPKPVVAAVRARRS